MKKKTKKYKTTFKSNQLVLIILFWALKDINYTNSKFSQSLSKNLDYSHLIQRKKLKTK